MSSGKPRLIVTGANGFIGRRVVKRARARGWTVIALLRDPAVSAFSSDPGVSVLQWEIGQPLPVGSADALCHLAAYVPPDFSDPALAAECFRINTLGALRLVEDLAAGSVGRLVHVSSGQVYAPHAGLSGEDAPTHPSERAGYYLSSKLAADHCLQYFTRSHPLALTIVRPASVYGPGMKGKGIIQHFMRNLRQGAPVDVTDGGSYRADFVHADDVADLTLAAIERDADGVFNAGSGQGRTALEVAQVIADSLGAKRALIRVTGDPLPPPQGFATLDIDKAKRLLAYRPRSLEAGIGEWLAEDRERAAQRSQ